MSTKFLFRHKGSIAISLVAFFIIFCKISWHWLATLSWKSIECDPKVNCTKILLVADSQLIGLHNKLFLASSFAIWDSDRYLSTTFAYAFKFAQPDMVIVWGDLFDEGSESTIEEFQSYMIRLRRIFEQEWMDGVKRIYVPGDNDVADESSNFRSQSKVQQFEEFFNQSLIFWTKKLKIHYRNWRFHTNVHSVESENGSVVGINNLPLILTKNNHTDQIPEQLESNVIFSAPTPKVGLYNENYEDKRKIKIGQVHEFVVPSCSYRTRNNKIGYGLVVIDNEKVWYTVLWTASRFIQLTMYAILILLCMCWYIIILTKELLQSRYSIMPTDEV